MSYYLACRIGTEWYGISIDAVSEVLHILALRQLPQSNLAGIMTLREKVMPVVDLRHQLGIENYHYQLDTPIIALELLERYLGVIVDEADDVLSLDESNIQAYFEGFVEGVAHLGERLLFIINLPELLARTIENTEKI